jgi:tetratricopeptide (TPR) repeat protein
MKKTAVLLLLATSIFACQADQTSQLQQRLLELDKALGGLAVTDASKANDFIKTSEELAALLQASDPNQAAEVRFKAASLAKTVEQPQKAIELYASVLANAPQSPKAATAQFMTGFIYANDLNELDKAKVAYEAFLQKYPNDELAESAKMELQNLGKSPEELIKAFDQAQ